MDTNEWKSYKIDKSFDDNTRLAFSKYGEIMSFTKHHPNGRIINGGLVEGYPVIKFEILKPLDEKAKKSIEDQEQNIAEIKISTFIANMNTIYAARLKAACSDFNPINTE